MTTTLPEPAQTGAFAERTTLFVDREGGSCYMDLASDATADEVRGVIDLALSQGVIFDPLDDELIDAAPDGRVRHWGIFTEEVVPDWITE